MKKWSEKFKKICEWLKSGGFGNIIQDFFAMIKDFLFVNGLV